MKKVYFTKVNYLFFITFIAGLFFIFNSGIIKINLLSILDEFLLVFAVLIVLGHIIRQLVSYKVSKLYLFLLLYLASGSINYSISPFSNSYILMNIQMLINLKVFLISLGVILLYKDASNYNKSIKYIWNIFIGFFILGMLLNWILGASWNLFMGEEVSYRLGWIRPAGWFGSAGLVGYYFIMTFVTWYMLYSKEKVIRVHMFVRKYILFVILDFFASYPLTLRKQMFINAPFLLFILSLFPKRKAIVIGSIIFLFLLAFLFTIRNTELLAITTDNFSKFSHDDHTYIRGLIFYYGFNLFLENFPFGVGSATFGTVLSSYNTLDVYRYVGLPLSRIYDGVRLDGVYDSGIASFLAENGFISSILAFIFIYHFFKFNQKLLDSYNYQIFKMLTLFTIIVSLIGPAWQNAFFTTFYVINVLFIYTKINRYKEKGKWIYYTKTQGIDHENTSNL